MEDIDASSSLKYSFENMMVRRESIGASHRRSQNLFAPQESSGHRSRVQIEFSSAKRVSFTNQREQTASYYNAFYKYNKLSQKDSRFLNRSGAP